MKHIFSSNDEKLTDKAFSQNLLVSILSILLCIVALCSITYAWFTTNVSSGENIIESGRFALDILVTGEDGIVNATDSANGIYRYTFANVGEYTVVFKMTDDTTASKGYCEMTINATEKMQTEPISKDTTIGLDPFTFTIEITHENTVIVFEPKWGISASPDVSNADRLVVSSTATSGDEQG